MRLICTNHKYGETEFTTRNSVQYSSMSPSSTILLVVSVYMEEDANRVDKK